MAGYNWHKGMSNNAVDCYDEGKMPISKWTKTAILEAISQALEDDQQHLVAVAAKHTLATLKAKLLERTEWHHTGKYYNRTDFYGLVADLAEAIENLEPVPARRKAATSSDEPKEYAIITFLEFNKVKGRWRARERRVGCELKSGWGIALDGSGKKKLGGNGIQEIKKCDKSFAELVKLSD